MQLLVEIAPGVESHSLFCICDIVFVNFCSYTFILSVPKKVQPIYLSLC